MSRKWYFVPFLCKNVNYVLKCTKVFFFLRCAMSILLMLIPNTSIFYECWWIINECNHLWRKPQTKIHSVCSVKQVMNHSECFFLCQYVLQRASHGYDTKHVAYTDWTHSHTYTTCTHTHAFYKEPYFTGATCPGGITMKPEVPDKILKASAHAKYKTSSWNNSCFSYISCMYKINRVMFSSSVFILS